jgi:hypothetical protein
MAYSLSLRNGPDRIYVDWEIDAGSHTLRRRAYTVPLVVPPSGYDIITTMGAGAGGNSGTFEDTGVVQEWAYDYIIADDLPSVVASATGGKLFQAKAYGRREGAGGHTKRTITYKIECELCGFKYPRNVFRRGYVKPHVVAENYVTNSAAPENWEWAAAPLYYDINAYFQANSIEHTVCFPQIEKPLEKGSRYGGGMWYPGVPCEKITGADFKFVEVGTTQAAKSGYAIVWIYHLEGTRLTVSVRHNTGSWVTIGAVNMNDMSQGWHRAYFECSWNASVDIGVRFSRHPAEEPIFGFGGVQLVENNVETACLPDRATGVGEYTTGGMMDLCPDCYSGLRRRVPWE